MSDRLNELQVMRSQHHSETEYWLLNALIDLQIGMNPANSMERAVISYSRSLKEKKHENPASL